MKYLFKLSTNGELSDASGKYLGCLGDNDSIFQFMNAVRLTLKAIGHPDSAMPIFDDVDNMLEWENAAVARVAKR